MWRCESDPSCKPCASIPSPHSVPPCAGACTRRNKKPPACGRCVGTCIFVGNPHGVRTRNRGRHHNQRISGWEYGQDMAYLAYKSKQVHIKSFTGSERGTSSQCRVCGWKRRVKGRRWRCRNPECSFSGHRDVVGSVNMHPLAYGSKIAFPARIMYQRAGPERRLARSKQPCQVQGR